MLNRPLYEIQLEELSKQAGCEIKEVERLTDIELMTQINNWRIYFGVQPYPNDEIQRILNDH